MEIPKFKSFYIIMYIFILDEANISFWTLNAIL